IPSTFFTSSGLDSSFCLVAVIPCCGNSRKSAAVPRNGIALIFSYEEQRRRQHGGIEVLPLKLEEPLRNIPASDTDQLHVPIWIQPVMLQDSSRNVISRSHGP